MMSGPRAPPRRRCEHSAAATQWSWASVGPDPWFRWCSHCRRLYLAESPRQRLLAATVLALARSAVVKR